MFCMPCCFRMIIFLWCIYSFFWCLFRLVDESQFRSFTFVCVFFVCGEAHECIATSNSVEEKKIEKGKGICQRERLERSFWLKVVRVVMSCALWLLLLVGLGLGEACNYSEDLNHLFFLWGHVIIKKELLYDTEY